MHTQCCCGRRSCPWLYWKTLKANELAKAARASLVQTQPFAQTFGAKQTRKRPRLSAETYSDLLGHAAHHSAK